MFCHYKFYSAKGYHFLVKVILSFAKYFFVLQNTFKIQYLSLKFSKSNKNFCYGTRTTAH